MIKFQSSAVCVYAWPNSCHLTAQREEKKSFFHPFPVKAIKQSLKDFICNKNHSALFANKSKKNRGKYKYIFINSLTTWAFTIILLEYYVRKVRISENGQLLGKNRVRSRSSLSRRTNDKIVVHSKRAQQTLPSSHF
ncbi:hypothetical protein BpHYR1_006384 [Brachionus plicatilis]|uniref:Uncharacterized protein n=1 Tax=Brachionus plicatilis TaxID=10195 RepID=A0A3M7R6V2_BRAPC|nr:hypothetical protein BpHYR1_006384 [Brachionus plicatilis]